MKKPASFIVFGILNIIFAAIFMCCLGLYTFGAVLPNEAEDPSIHAIQHSAIAFAWVWFNGIFGQLMAVILIAAGVGLLLGKAWGRLLSLAYCWWMFISVPIGIIIHLSVLYPVVMNMVKNHENATEPGFMVGAYIGFFGASLCPAISSLIYPVILMIFLHRKVLKDYLAQEQETNPWGTNPYDPTQLGN